MLFVIWHCQHGDIVQVRDRPVGRHAERAAHIKIATVERQGTYATEPYVQAIVRQCIPGTANRAVPGDRIQVRPAAIGGPGKRAARVESGVIEVDTATTLRGVPAEAWQYQRGTYSALEWVLERHKQKTPKQPTIREKFNTYRFAEHKEQVIELLERVCTVSVQTMQISGEMPEA